MRFSPGNNPQARIERIKAAVHKRRSKKISRYLKKYWKARKDKERVRGEWKKFITYEESLVRYKADIDLINQVAFTTCYSQTKQWAPNRALGLMSFGLHNFGIKLRHDDLNDLEQTVQFLWWVAYKDFREKQWTYKPPSLRWYLINQVCYKLPKELSIWATKRNRMNVVQDETYYPITDTKLVEISDLLTNTNSPYLSLLSNREKLILYLLERNPGKYSQVAKLLSISPATVSSIANDIAEKLGVI
jgi:DNA-binding CsgD family transcriptional regulator